MGIKDLRIMQNLSKSFDKVKDNLGNSAVHDNLKKSHTARKEKVASKSAAVDKAAMRKQLGVDKKTNDEIHSNTDAFSPKNPKHAERLFDRATQGAGPGKLLSSKGLHAAAESIAEGVRASYPSMEGARLSKTIMAEVKGKLGDDVHAAIDGSKLSTSNKATAKTLAKGLLHAMDYDADSHVFIEKAGTKSFRQVADAENSKRNTVQRFFDRKTSKIGASVNHAGKSASKLGSQAQQLGNTATRKGFDALTTVAAGTAVGASAVAGVALSPVGAAAKLAYNVGAGVVSGAKAAGATIKKKTAADTEQVRSQFRPVEQTDARPKKSR